MSRPKSSYLDLPPNVTARKSGNKLIYYYQLNGKKFPLGTDYANAAARAAFGKPAIEKARHLGNFASLTAEKVVAGAISPRPQSGIYFLIANNTVAYVGQSRQVFARICQHMKKKTFDSFYWIACAVEDLDSMEQHCIDKFKPWMNVRTRIYRTDSESFRTASPKP